MRNVKIIAAGTAAGVMAFYINYEECKAEAFKLLAKLIASFYINYEECKDRYDVSKE